MIIQRQATETLRPDQIRAMARGLCFFAGVDGIAEVEKKLIREFLEEGNLDTDLEALAKVPFSLDELLYSLDTVFLRKTFLKICLVLARSDGVISQGETLQLRRLAQAMGIDEPLDSLVEEVKDKSLA